MSAVTCRVFKMNECDWVVARDLQQAMKAIYELIGDQKETEEQCEGAYEVKDADLDTLKFIDDDEQTVRTFRDEIIRHTIKGTKLPYILASTEY